MPTGSAPQEQQHEAGVAIIGCGPVGAMLANLLGLQGVTTLVRPESIKERVSWKLLD